MRSEMEVGGGAANSHEVLGGLARRGVRPATLSTQHPRRRHSTTPSNSEDAGPGERSVAGRVPAAPSSALDPKASQEAKSALCVQDRS